MAEHRTVQPTTQASVEVPAPTGPDLCVEWLGTVPYADALTLQETAVRERLAGLRGDRLLLLEHPQVVTLGRSTDPENLRLGEDELRAAGVDFFEVGRGGDVTYHAPGQLVGYPIIDLDALGRRDVHAHLRSLEAALIDTLEDVGIAATRIPGWTGVFIDRERSSRSMLASDSDRERKIASIGIGIRRWVTFHGFALNVTIDLEGFESIVPCGLRDVEMTSVELELGAEPGKGGAARAELDELMRASVARQMRRHLARSAAL